jgi:SAM-dependent methyltransferase
MDKYVHGYSDRETQRLHDQAGSVRDLFHRDTTYPAGSKVLEVGCGVGAQSVTLARNSPDATFASFDISFEHNVSLHRANLFATPFRSETFDHLFVCHVVEHQAEPVAALMCLRELLRSDGSITVIEGDHGSCYFHPVIEGDHGSCYFHPESDESLRAWNCLIEVQARLGGNSLVGRELYPLLTKAGNNTIIPMVAGVRMQALEMGLIDAVAFDKGIQDLYDLAASKDGAFCYTFFKGTGRK